MARPLPVGATSDPLYREIFVTELQLFDLVWATTKGGPVNASNTMAIYMYDWGFRRQELGYGSAVAVIIFIIALVTLIVLALPGGRRKAEISDKEIA